MLNPRDPIFNALLSLISTPATGTCPFVTVSRKFQMWSNVTAENQPALYLRVSSQRSSEVQAFGLPTWKLDAKLWIYAMHSSDDDSPGTILNTLLDYVDAQLSPSTPGGLQTLGGMVINCYIDGEILIDEGLIPSDLQGIAMVPVTIIAGADCSKY